MRRVFAVVLCLFVAAATNPLRAQGPGPGSAVTPPGSRIGLLPLTGFMESNDFMGFADATTGASVMLTEMPAEAWAQMREGLTAQALQQRGIQELARSSFTMATGEAVLIEGVQAAGGMTVGKFMLIFPGPGFTGMVTVNLPPAAADKYPRADVHTMLASTIAVSTAAISPREALGFVFEETPRLKLFQTFGRQVAMLRQSGPEQNSQAAAVISVTRVPVPPSDPAAHASRVLEALQQFRDVVVTRSVARQVGTLAGIEQRATARARAGGGPVGLYHLMLVDGDRVVSVVGFAPAATAESWMPEFTALGDSVRLR